MSSTTSDNQLAKQQLTPMATAMDGMEGHGTLESLGNVLGPVHETLLVSTSFDTCLSFDPLLGSLISPLAIALQLKSEIDIQGNTSVLESPPTFYAQLPSNLPVSPMSNIVEDELDDEDDIISLGSVPSPVRDCLPLEQMLVNIEMDNAWTSLSNHPESHNHDLTLQEFTDVTLKDAS